jgi:hypothetical protein
MMNISRNQLKFDMMDRDGLVRSYPPSSMSAPTTYITNNQYGAGLYTASASSSWPGESAFEAFQNVNSDVLWCSTQLYNSAGQYTGSTLSVGYNMAHTSITNFEGEYLQIELPYAMCLTSHTIIPWALNNACLYRSPQQYVVLSAVYSGSTISYWNIIDSQSGITDWTSAQQTFVCNPGNAGVPSTTYRIVVQVIGNNLASNNPNSIYGQGYANFKWSLNCASVARPVVPGYNADIDGILSAGDVVIPIQPYGLNACIATILARLTALDGKTQ